MVSNRNKSSKNNTRHTREKLRRILNTTKVRIFKNDPITWIPQDHVANIKRDISWHLYELTHLLNMECWGIVVDILFQKHSRTLFSLIYQLSNTSYLRSTLPLLTTQSENYQSLKKIASIYNTNIVLYEPNYIPQYLRIKTHYLNLISCDNPNSKKTMVIYSEPIECLYSMDYKFQLGSLIDLRYEENIRTFFDISKCLIDYKDFDNDFTNEETDEEESRNLRQTFKEKFEASMDESKYKAFVALWCESENSDSIPEEWWPYPDNRALTIQEFVLLLIKVSTTYSGTGIIIYKTNYYCICKDSHETDMTVCEVHDDGQLTIPNHFLRSDLGSKYKRGSLADFVKNSNYLYVY